MLWLRLSSYTTLPTHLSRIVRHTCHDVLHCSHACVFFQFAFSRPGVGVACRLKTVTPYTALRSRTGVQRMSYVG